MSVSAMARFLKAPTTSNRILILKTVIIHSAVLRWEGYVAYIWKKPGMQRCSGWYPQPELKNKVRINVFI
jgi:hypothetical protein